MRVEKQVPIVSGRSLVSGLDSLEAVVFPGCPGPTSILIDHGWCSVRLDSKTHHLGGGAPLKKDSCWIEKLQRFHLCSGKNYEG